MTLNDQKEQFSIAYVRAVAAAACLKIVLHETDDESVDIGLGRSGGNGTLRSPRCDIQLKCTEQDLSASDTVDFTLKLKNYNDLRTDNLHVPKILVVMFVPATVKNWLKHFDKLIIMRHCAFWYSLRGLPATQNQSSVTVHIPVSQRFTVDSLTCIIDRIGDGGLP